MWEASPGVWRCLIHGPNSPEWQAARALGAAAPCQIPKGPTLVLLAGQLPLDPDTAAMILNTTNSEIVRQGLATNPTTPMDILVELARTKRGLVRSAAASNPALTPDILDQLSRSKSADLRSGVATNPAAPDDVLERLAEDRSEVVVNQAEAALMERRRQESIAAAVERGDTPADFAALMYSPSCPPHILLALLQDREVGTWIIRNPTIIQEARQRLTDRPGVALRTILTEILQERIEQQGT